MSFETTTEDVDISKDGCTATKNIKTPVQARYYQRSARTREAFHPGTITILDFLITQPPEGNQIYQHPIDAAIGVAIPEFELSSESGIFAVASPISWTYGGSSGHLWHGKKFQRYVQNKHKREGRTNVHPNGLIHGDVLHMEVNMGVGTIHFWLNDLDLGVAFDNLNSVEELHGVIVFGESSYTNIGQEDSVTLVKVVRNVCSLYIICLRSVRLHCQSITYMNDGVHKVEIDHPSEEVTTTKEVVTVKSNVIHDGNETKTEITTSVAQITTVTSVTSTNYATNSVAQVLPFEVAEDLFT